MSWHFSQALVAEFSEATCLDGGQSAPSSGNPTQKLYSSSDKMMEFCRRSPYGMTCEPLTDDHGRAVLMSFLEAFPAKTLAPQEKAQDSTESNLGSGLKWCGSFVRYDHDTHLWKTPQCSLLEGLDAFSETWPKWGSMRNGECWALTKWARLTKENEFGSLPTPSGTSNHGRNHVSGRLDEWGGSSNPWRGTEIGKVHCASFEEWVMGWPVLGGELTPLGTDRFQQWQRQHGRF